MNFIIKFLAGYGYMSIRELFESLFPSWKYELHGLSLILSVISGVFGYLFGFGLALAIAMIVSIIAEIVTGIIASRKLGNSFESFRFSRCILKLALWSILFYIINAFVKEYSGQTDVLDTIAYIFFKIVFLGSMSMFFVEHVTSILENISVIDGKEKTYLIDFIQDSWKGMLETFKGKIK